MRKFTVFLILFLVSVAGFLSAQQMKLDRAVARTAAALEGVLPQKAKVAVLNFTSPSTVFSEYVIEELTGELVNGNKLTVVDRHNLELITQEMKLQLSGEVSDASAQAVGKKLGAQSIVSGSLTNMGTFQRFRIKVINVETAAIQTQVSYDIQNDDQVTFLLSGNAPAQASAGQSSGQTNSQAASPTQVYKVGDKGPAGGIVFYDLGYYMDGWRYLEAAPRDVGPAEWGAYRIYVTGGTNSGIGNGKTNTERIISQLKQGDENGRAAQFCAAMTINGYTGWFLPSREELNSMYVNLKLKGLGGFSNGYYWSSSDTDAGYWAENAWGQRFNDGKQDYLSKRASYSVRAVRQF